MLTRFVAMKYFYTPTILALVCLPAIAADAPARIAMRDVPTHEQVVEAAAKALEETPPPVFKPVEGEDPSVAYKPVDLISRSDIVCHNGLATLIPKRAVVHTPKGMAGRMAMQDGARLVNWSDFFNANRAWIRTIEVSRVQAEGNKSLDEATLKSFEKETRLVVAVLEQGPISVLPLQIPEEDSAKTATPGASPNSDSTASNVAKP